MDLTDILGVDEHLGPQDLVAELPDDLMNSLHKDLFPDPAIQLPDPSLQDGLLHDLSDSSSDSGVSGKISDSSSDSGVSGKIDDMIYVTVAQIVDSDSGVGGKIDGMIYMIVCNSSSESGVSGVMMKYDGPSHDVKQEPLSPRSPALSFSSENSDSQGYLSNDMKTESPPGSPDLDLSHSATTLNFAGINNPQQPLVLPNVTQHPVQINSIMNSKVKIQPKPSDSVQQKVPIPKLGQGKQLVLTPDEFKRLTSQGLLKFQNPSQGTKASLTNPTHVVAPSSTFVSANPILQVDNEIKAIKRQQRMIKNRESASLSRKRKKEYLTQLEQQLQESTTQNQRLKEENESLKRKLSYIQNENDELKKTVSVSPSKRVCLMAVFLIFSLNVVQFSDYLLTDKIKRSHSNSEIPAHKSRQLLSVLNDEDSYSVGNFMPPASMQKFIQENPELLSSNSSLLQLFTCPTSFNKTESIRLAEQLSGWMQSVKKEKEKKQPLKEKKNSEKHRRRFSPVQAAIRGNADRFSRHALRGGDYQYQVQVYDGVNNGNFWNSVPRRNDTFYVLSFSTDYFLVPATAHNKTMRPRMSLVMPAVALNGSMHPPPGNVGMMQIDCEVLNTQLIHVHKSALPKQTWHRNGTFHDGYRP
ncbi:hypothetical protein FSP39_014992 [Pinctada imbricata]|uniref:BZIP domain-containing protein n=1 Tax=Pinctada imbricata TaxID=66713 RepID=A0AA89BRA2_PINIB|nr:hypothetical protein FSP39_014992 [Pinctada imbricata]